MGRLLLSHEADIRAVAASTQGMLVLQDKDFKASLASVRSQWHTTIGKPTPASKRDTEELPVEREATVSLRTVSHAFLLQAMGKDWQLPPDLQTKLAYLQARPATYYDRALVRMQPRHPTPMKEKDWIFSLAFSQSTEGVELLTFWREVE
eukprot:69680-Amphidinium_carterae.1